MLAWGQALNVHFSTVGMTGNCDYPETLSEIAPESFSVQLGRRCELDKVFAVPPR